MGDFKVCYWLGACCAAILNENEDPGAQAFIPPDMNTTTKATV